MFKAKDDVSRSWTDLKKLGFSDELGNYGYTGEYKGRKCVICKNEKEKKKKSVKKGSDKKKTNKSCYDDKEDMLQCADDKFNSAQGSESDIENRKMFALIDIAMACNEGRLCYQKDEDGVPRMPNPICVKHNKCGIPGTSIYDVYRDFTDYWKDMKDMFFSIKQSDKESNIKRQSKKPSRREKKKLIKKGMGELIKKYNSLPYPDLSDGSFLDGIGNNNNNNNSDSISGNNCKTKKSKAFYKLLNNSHNDISESVNNTQHTINTTKGTGTQKKRTNLPTNNKQKIKNTKKLNTTGGVKSTNGTDVRGSDSTNELDEYVTHISEKLKYWHKNWISDKPNRQKIGCGTGGEGYAKRTGSRNATTMEMKSIEDIDIAIPKNVIKKITSIPAMLKFQENSGQSKQIELGDPRLQKYYDEHISSGEENMTKMKEPVSEEVEEAFWGFSCTTVRSTGEKTGEYGKVPIKLDTKNFQQCRCHTFIPTGIFQYDWIYFRKCLYNFKLMIDAGYDPGHEDVELVETYAKLIFMDDFLRRFSGPFKEYRDILLEFAKKYDNVCKLDRHVVDTNKGMHKDKLKNFAKVIKEGIKYRACINSGKGKKGCGTTFSYNSKQLNSTHTGSLATNNDEDSLEED